MPLLLEISMNNGFTRISNEWCNLENKWKGHLMESAPIYRQLSHDYGGYMRVDAKGDLKISPEAFSSVWPPPRIVELIWKYTDSTTSQAGAVELFRAAGHFYGPGEKEMAYQVKADAITTNLLDEGENNDGDLVSFPRAFGDVAFWVPVRIADHASGNWQYHNGYLGGSLSNIITGFADNGSGGTTVTLNAAHGWSNGDTVFIDDTGEHYDGSYSITAASGAVSSTFPPPLFPGPRPSQAGPGSPGTDHGGCMWTGFPTPAPGQSRTTGTTLSRFPLNPWAN